MVKIKKCSLKFANLIGLRLLDLTLFKKNPYTDLWIDMTILSTKFWKISLIWTIRKFTMLD